MDTLPHFEEYGYRVLEKLSQNIQGGRITYKAIEIATQTDVVIKQFRFATSQDWSAYKQVEREINVLKGLKHSGIPRYLNVFAPTDGICLVQDYKNASNLSFARTFIPEEIKNIAIQLLEILIYLQNRIPLVIHRDIKPENVLVNEQLQVYLIDFGFARIGSGDVTALSSIVAGTTGFMPPEQLLNKSLTEASDLYGLGATLICLLAGIKSTQLSDFFGYDFRIDYKDLVSKYSLRFIDWLEQMVEPDFTKRFPDAQTALKALIPIDLIRVPEVNLDKLDLVFTATSLGEKLSQSVTVSNEIIETVLQGKWSVSPHKSDPPHTPDDHAWISFSPKEFKSNKVECHVIVDTSKLRADKDYEREIVLTSNARQANYHLRIKVKTASLPVAVKKPPYLRLVGICVAVTIVSVIVGAIVGAIVEAIVGLIDKFNERGFNNGVAWLYCLLTCGLGVSIGAAIILSFTPYGILAVAATSLPLAGMLLYPPLQNRRLIEKYRQQEQHLIEP